MLLLATLVFFAAPQGNEAEWYRVANDAKTAAYVARNNITTDGDLRSAMVATIGAAPMASNGAAAMLAKHSFNCATGLVSDLKITYLGATGAVIGSEVPASGFHAVVKGSNVAAAQRFVCSDQGGTRITDPKADSDALFGR